MRVATRCCSAADGGRVNPFTRFLSQWSSNRRLAEFIAHWDVLESVVVGVYREKMSVAEAQPLFAETWPWLRQAYPQWEQALRPFWQQTQAGGAPTAADPFQLLLAFAEPGDILGDWRAMQHLPAAREALNQFVLSQSSANT